MQAMVSGAWPPVSRANCGPRRTVAYRRSAIRGRCEGVAWFGKRSERLRPLDEAAAYARCHGDRDETVKRVSLPPRRPRNAELLATGEQIRSSLEARLDSREPADTAPTPSPSLH